VQRSPDVRHIEPPNRGASDLDFKVPYLESCSSHASWLPCQSVFPKIEIINFDGPGDLIPEILKQLVIICAWSNMRRYTTGWDRGFEPDVLRESIKDESVDLFYLDPPLDAGSLTFKKAGIEHGEDKQVDLFADPVSTKKKRK
jgi:hypothetical protein